MNWDEIEWRFKKMSDTDPFYTFSLIEPSAFRIVCKPYSLFGEMEHRDLTWGGGISADRIDEICTMLLWLDLDWEVVNEKSSQDGDHILTCVIRG